MLDKKSVIEITRKRTLPAGEYAVCDPCYTLGLRSEGRKGNWKRLLEETEWLMMKTKNRGGVMSIDGVPFAVFSTAHGDGAFLGSDGNEYGVDAGCIGCIPLELAESKPDGEFIHLYKSEKPFKVYYFHGDIVFGELDIATDPWHY